jgi:hypothetical protein
MTEHDFRFPDDDTLSPSCLTCGAVVREDDMKRHIEWHDALLYLANTLVMDLGMADPLLKYSSRL